MRLEYLSFEKRKEFFEMLDDILDYRRVEKVIIAYKNRLSRMGFERFHHLFRNFGTENNSGLGNREQKA